MLGESKACQRRVLETHKWLLQAIPYVLSEINHQPERTALALLRARILDISVAQAGCDDISLRHIEKNSAGTDHSADLNYLLFTSIR